MGERYEFWRHVRSGDVIAVQVDSETGTVLYATDEAIAHRDMLAGAESFEMGSAQAAILNQYADDWALVEDAPPAVVEAIDRLEALRDELGLDYDTLGPVDCVGVTWDAGAGISVGDDHYGEAHPSEEAAAEALRRWREGYDQKDQDDREEAERFAREEAALAAGA